MTDISFAFSKQKYEQVMMQWWWHPLGARGPATEPRSGSPTHYDVTAVLDLRHLPTSRIVGSLDILDRSIVIGYDESEKYFLGHSWMGWTTQIRSM